jgi:hypothetical protein
MAVLRQVRRFDAAGDRVPAVKELDSHRFNLVTPEPSYASGFLP